ncbi:MAG: hypothetical protein IPL35_03740 [Sphingobacteriales bacterium]|nr:hypothetical protein [Sphingobacteriales bacterium]
MKITQLFLVLFVFSLWSCQKDNLNENENLRVDQTVDYGNPTIEKGILNFKNEAHFEEYMVSLDDSTKLKSLQAMTGFSSLYKTVIAGATDPNAIDEKIEQFNIDDKKLLSTINANHEIIIGEWYFKFFPSSKEIKVYSLVNYRANNLTNEQIYSFNDDVFEGLEKGIFGCGETCKQEKEDGTEKEEYCTMKNSGNTYQIRLKSIYNSYGVWRKLQSKFKHKCSSGISCWGIDDATSFSVGYNTEWKKRCKNAGAGYKPVVCLDAPPATDILDCGQFADWGTSWEHMHYQGTRCLSVFKLKTWVGFTNVCTLLPEYRETEEIVGQ